MSSPSSLDRAALDRLRPHAVPVVIFSMVVFVTTIVPPLVLGEVTTRTYAITAAVFILAVGAVLPYALLVAVGTLPLLYTGLASFGAPQPAPDAAYTFSRATALRHVVAGVAYVLSAAVVGAIGFGAQMGSPDEVAGVPAAEIPSLLVLGGVLVAGTFVTLQLWRSGTTGRTLDRDTTLGTALLGLLVAVSPIVAFWVFNTP